MYWRTYALQPRFFIFPSRLTDVESAVFASFEPFDLSPAAGQQNGSERDELFDTAMFPLLQDSQNMTHAKAAWLVSDNLQALSLPWSDNPVLFFQDFQIPLCR